MDAVVAEIEGLLPSGVTSSTHGREVMFMLETYRSFKNGAATLQDVLFDSRAVMDRTWEMLNVGRWADAPVRLRQAYAIACLVHVIALLRDNKEDAIKKSLEVTDLGLLLGHPFREMCLTRVADILSVCTTSVDGPPLKRAKTKGETEDIVATLKNEIDSRSRPSLELFFREHIQKGIPVKIVDAMDHWPALKLWTDFEYIKAKAGCRTVPIEIGKHYADSSYRQKLMKVSDFIDKFFDGNSPDIGYLAQHQLFDQVPELRKDIVEPDYCALTEKDDETSDVEVNAWFGPKGTVSPLHFDPKKNVLCQVVGVKKVVLFPETDGEFLYPHEGIHSNTSQVDVENPDVKAFPKFEKAVPRECLLRPGEMLYIPPKYWHHVRALSDSFSVSFWWE